MKNQIHEINGQDLKKSLELCTGVAKEEYRAIKHALENIRRIFNRAQVELRNSSSRFDINPNVRKDMEEAVAQIRQALSRKLPLVEQEVSSLSDHLSKFRIALFGRTMAGKSTIREAITGGNGSTIGRGAQDTTRDVLEYYWNKLCIVDTPGIASFERDAELRKKALKAAFESDVVMFLVSSDSVQESVFEGMKEIFSRNKHVLFVLNVKRDLTKGIFMKRFLEAPEKFFRNADIKGHIDRLRDLVKNLLGFPHIHVVPIHAQAAFLATQRDYAHVSEALYRGSSLESLHKKLSEYVVKWGPILRTRTMIDGLVCPVFKVLDEINSSLKAAKQEVDFIWRRTAELEHSLNKIKTEFNYNVNRVVDQIGNTLRGHIGPFVDENVENEDAEKRWKEKVNAVVESHISNFLRETDRKIKNTIESWQNAVQFDLSYLQTMNLGLDTGSVIDTKFIFSLISILTGALVFLLASINIIGLVICGLVSFFTSLFESKEEKLRKKKSKMREKLVHNVADVEEKLRKELVKILKSKVSPNIDRSISEIRTELQRLNNGMRIADNLVQDVRKELSDVNTRLVVKCLRFANIIVDENSFYVKFRHPGKMMEIAVSSENVFSKEAQTFLQEILREKIEIVHLEKSNVYPTLIKPQSGQADNRFTKSSNSYAYYLGA